MSEHLDAFSDDTKRRIANMVWDGLAVAKDLQDRLADLPLNPDQARALERSLRLGELTHRNLSLMRQLLDEHFRHDCDIASLWPLASLGRDRWLDLAFAQAYRRNRISVPMNMDYNWNEPSRRRIVHFPLGLLLCI
jgi:hypothetical protein